MSPGRSAWLCGVGLLLAAAAGAQSPGPGEARPPGADQQPAPGPPSGAPPLAAPTPECAAIEPPSEPGPGPRYRPLRLPTVDMPPAEDHTARRVYAPRHYTGRAPMLVGPGLRVAPGMSGRVSGEQSFAFALDVMAGGRIGLHPGDEQWVLVPELGYSLRAPATEHALSVGLGLGRGEGDSAPSTDARTVFGGISYVPRLVLDPNGQGCSFGVRHGVLLDHHDTTFALELAHQYMYKDGLHHNEIRLTVSLDVLLAAIMLSGR